MMMHAIVKADIAPLYTEPSRACERADEALYGMELSLLRPVGDGWYYARTHYRYEGYVHESGLHMDDKAAEAWRQAAKYVVKAPYIDIQKEPRVQAPCLTSVPRGGLIVPDGEPDGEEWLPVRLADGQTGFTKRSRLGGQCTVWDRADEEKLRDALVETALSYLGTQYRWGGKTPLGIDCSGLASMSYLLNGVVIYRDAAIKPGFDMHSIEQAEMKKGDLIFFPGHVALYMGDRKFIHSTGHRGTEGVVINSFDPDAPDYRGDLLESITAIGSIF